MAEGWLSETIDKPARDASPAAGPRSPLSVLAVAGAGRGSGGTRYGLGGAESLTFETASRLPPALKRIARGGIDLVLVELDGSEPSWRALRRLLERAPHLPLVVSLDPRGETRGIEAVRLGAQDYVLRHRLKAGEMERVARCAIERHRHLAALRDLSLTDPLTGVYNRRGFEALAEAQLRLTRRHRRGLLILCADLDDLKRINDAHGHAGGDRALKTAAKLLRASLRDSDIVARVGGDEFAALVHETSGRDARAVEARIASALDELNGSLTLPYRLSLSIGWVEYDGVRDASLARLMAHADRSLYRAKRRPGRTT